MRYKKIGSSIFNISIFCGKGMVVVRKNG